MLTLSTGLNGPIYKAIRFAIKRDDLTVKKTFIGSKIAHVVILDIAVVGGVFPSRRG